MSNYESDTSTNHNNISNWFQLAATGQQLPLSAPVDNSGQSIPNWNQYSSSFTNLQENFNKIPAKEKQYMFYLCTPSTPRREISFCNHYNRLPIYPLQKNQCAYLYNYQSGTRKPPFRCDDTSAPGKNMMLLLLFHINNLQLCSLLVSLNYPFHYEVRQRKYKISFQKILHTTAPSYHFLLF